MASDQRGAPRPQGAGCDVGAFEVDRAALIASPASQDFGDVVVGDSSAVQTVTIESVGGVDLVLGQLAPSGAAAAEFTISNDTCSNQTIAPTLTCSFDVNFAPSTSGVRDAQVDVPSNASTGPDAVALTGIGLSVTEVPALDYWGLTILAGVLALLGCLRSRATRAGSTGS